MITWKGADLKPDVNNKDEFDIENQFSEKCIVIVDDKQLGYPVSFGVYMHKLNEWNIEGYRSSGGRFKVKFWSAITKPAHINK